MELPLNRWIHIEIAAGLGDGSRSTWDMIVMLPGRAPREFKALRNAHTTFDQLTWIGFTSNATEKTVFYLDNIELSNDV